MYLQDLRMSVVSRVTSLHLELILITWRKYVVFIMKTTYLSRDDEDMKRFIKSHSRANCARESHARENLHCNVVRHRADSRRSHRLLRSQSPIYFFKLLSRERKKKHESDSPSRTLSLADDPSIERKILMITVSSSSQTSDMKRWIECTYQEGYPRTRKE